MTKLIKIFLITIFNTQKHEDIIDQRIMDYQPTDEQVSGFYHECANDPFLESVVVHSFYMPESQFQHLKETNKRVYSVQSPIK
jgi:hypothetical protein